MDKTRLISTITSIALTDRLHTTVWSYFEFILPRREPCPNTVVKTISISSSSYQVLLTAANLLLEIFLGFIMGFMVIIAYLDRPK
jgi:hypothetical protein